MLFRSQREPVVAPAGTVTEYRLPRRVSGCLVQFDKPSGDPSQWAEEMQISRTRGMRFAEKLPSGPVAGAARRDARTDQEGVARWASRRACGTRATPPMAGTAHGERGRVRNLGGRCGAGARDRKSTRLNSSH